jgi:hypothetical protein
MACWRYVLYDARHGALGLSITWMRPRRAVSRTAGVKYELLGCEAWDTKDSGSVAEDCLCHAGLGTDLLHRRLADAGG